MSLSNPTVCWYQIWQGYSQQDQALQDGNGSDSFRRNCVWPEGGDGVLTNQIAAKEARQVKQVKTWYLMVGAEHRRETWYLMNGAEHKVKTWYLMDGTEHSQQIKLYKSQE